MRNEVRRVHKRTGGTWERKGNVINKQAKTKHEDIALPCQEEVMDAGNSKKRKRKDKINGE